MTTRVDLERAFERYLTAMREAGRPGSYWALLHLVVALPDVCAALEQPDGGGQRYYDWCAENFPAGGALEPWDRYQIRCAVLHEGSSLPKDTTKKGTRPTQYVSISYVEPEDNGADQHGLVQHDGTRNGPNLIVNIKRLADETREAMFRWFARLEADPVRYAQVAPRLRSIANKRPKITNVPIELPPGTLPPGVKATIVFTHPTTSST